MRRTTLKKRAGETFLAAVVALFASLGWQGAGLADTAADEAKLAQCGKDICSIIVSRKMNGPDLDCDLSKTWDNNDIQKGADSAKLSWGLGSARCVAKVKARRADMIAALNAPEAIFRLERQSFACEIGAEKYPLRATIAPELRFRRGSTIAVSLHLENIQGAPLIKGFVWTAAALEENFGVLQKDMVREVNRFIDKACPKILGKTK